jgi:hypothetical protein
MGRRRVPLEKLLSGAYHLSGLMLPISTIKSVGNGHPEGDD